MFKWDIEGIQQRSQAMGTLLAAAAQALGVEDVEERGVSLRVEA